MQLIDDKGRVLGIINIVDLTVLLFLISTVSGFAWLDYTGILFEDFSDFNPKKEVFFDKQIEVILMEQPIPEVTLLKQEINRLNDTKDIPLRILRITSIKQRLATADYESVHIERRKNYYDITLLLAVRTKFDALEKVHYYEDTKLAPGNHLDINTGFFNAKATIINVLL